MDGAATSCPPRLANDRRSVTRPQPKSPHQLGGVTRLPIAVILEVLGCLVTRLERLACLKKSPRSTIRGV